MACSANIKSRLNDSGIHRTLLIAFTPRSGSTALGRALARAGIGRPDEYFQYPYEASEHWLGIDGGAFADRLVALASRFRQNGVFASKLALDHRAYLEEAIQRDRREECTLDDIFPEILWLRARRRNLVDQAVSAFIARNSGIWHLQTDVDAGEAGPVRYDFLEILAQLMIIGAAEANWDLYFRRARISPLELDYDDIVSDFPGTMARIHQALGIAHARGGAPSLAQASGLERQAEKWRDLYGAIRSQFEEDLMRIGRTDLRDRIGPDMDRWSDFFENKRWRSAS
ncbi:MAG: hypothetical protein KF776_17205 [Burkholderiales bacterium]|nr:hypothetical protein [Burkholderiales bacterium]